MKPEYVDASDLIQPDTRSDAQKWLDAQMDKRWANEQGAEPFPILESIALEIIEENQRLRTQIGQAAVMQQRPLTDEQIVDAYCKERGMRQYVEAYVAGARFAEAAHGIGEKK